MKFGISRTEYGVYDDPLTRRYTRGGQKEEEENKKEKKEKQQQEKEVEKEKQQQEAFNPNIEKNQTQKISKK